MFWVEFVSSQNVEYMIDQMHIRRQKDQIIILHNEIAEQDICFSKLWNTLNQADFSNSQDDFKKSVKLLNFLLLIDSKDSKFEN